MVEASRLQDRVYAQQDLLEALKNISQELEQGSIEALYELKELLRPHRSRRLELSDRIQGDRVGAKLFTIIWFLDEFVLDSLFANLGGDTMTGFPKEEGMPYMRSILISLGGFIQESLFRKGEPFERMIEAISTYFKLISICEEKLAKGDYSPDDWIVL